MNYVNSLDGTEKATEFFNCIPDEWRASYFGQCYSFDNCFGLAIFDLNFKKNKKGTEAHRRVKNDSLMRTRMENCLNAYPDCKGKRRK